MFKTNSKLMNMKTCKSTLSPSEGVIDVSVGFGHSPHFSKRKLIGRCLTVLAKDALKAHRGESANFKCSCYCGVVHAS